MATLTECTRCGRFDVQGELRGHCALCAPPPDVLESKQRVVDRRHKAAVEAATMRGAAGGRPVRHDVAWRSVSREAMPHLFGSGRGSGRSICGNQFGRGEDRRPASGVPGCRRCALAAGWIESLSEVVTV